MNIPFGSGIANSIFIYIIYTYLYNNILCMHAIHVNMYTYIVYIYIYIHLYLYISTDLWSMYIYIYTEIHRYDTSWSGYVYIYIYIFWYIFFRLQCRYISKVDTRITSNPNLDAPTIYGSRDTKNWTHVPQKGPLTILELLGKLAEENAI